MVLIGHFPPALARTEVRHADVAIDLGDHLGQLDLVASGSNSSKIAAPPMTEIGVSPATAMAPLVDQVLGDQMKRFRTYAAAAP